MKRVWPVEPMSTLDLHVSGQGSEFEAVGTISTTVRGIGAKVNWTVETTPQGQVTYVLRMRYSLRAVTMKARGRLNEDGTVLSGQWDSWGIENMLLEDIGPFIMCRLDPEILSARPPPWEFEEDRIGSLWRFALTAAKEQVLRSSYSWKFFKKRRDIRRRCVELSKQQTLNQWVNEAKVKEVNQAIRSLSPADARFYTSVANYEILHGPCVHSYVTSVMFAHVDGRLTQLRRDIYCCICYKQIVGSRMVCMTCAPMSMRTVNFCSKSACLVATVNFKDLPDLTSPHIMSHEYYQLRKTMHLREQKQYDAQAREALRKAHTVLDALGTTPSVDSGDSTTDVQRDYRGRPTCLGCMKPVTKPCWCCAECDGARLHPIRLR